MSVYQRISINHKPIRYKTPFGNFSQYVPPTVLGGNISEDIAYAWTGNNTLVDEIDGLILTNSGGVTFDIGQVNDAFLFDGASNLVIADSLEVRAEVEFTLCFMYLHAATGGTFSIIGKYTDPFTAEYNLLYNDGQIQFGFGTDFFRYQTSSGTFDFANWYFVSAWNSVIENQRGIRIKNLTDGTSFTDTQSGATAVDTSTSPLVIGGSNVPGYSRVQNGTKIDGIAKWNRILSLSEIESIENGIIGSEYPY